MFKPEKPVMLFKYTEHLIFSPVAITCKRAFRERGRKSHEQQTLRWKDSEVHSVFIKEPKTAAKAFLQSGLPLDADGGKIPVKSSQL